MEDVLEVYHLPYDPQRPVICLDELPFQLVGEKVAPLLMKKDKEKKFDSEYTRHGVATVFLAFEPLRGKRLVRVYPRRTKADYCRFHQEIIKEWAEAEVIVEVQDNLNTHNASSFYENLPATQARELTRHFEMHYTPKKASWLNMAEMELSALSRQCLSRRIPEIETLTSELEAIVKERNDLKIKFKWQFTVKNAREKLGRHYEKVILKT
jgi:hypothetical protein